MKRVIVSGAVIALTVAGTGVGQAAPAVYKITGGGQMTAVNQVGAGSTIAFTGQSQGAEGEPAKGQFQLQLRDGISKETIHGTITCVVVFSAGAEGMPAMAVLGGQSRAGEPLRIDVTDDGQGKDTMDMVSVRRGDEAQDGGDSGTDTDLCDQEDETAQMSLGRGNVKIHKAKATRS